MTDTLYLPNRPKGANPNYSTEELGKGGLGPGPLARTYPRWKEARKKHRGRESERERERECPEERDRERQFALYTSKFHQGCSRNRGGANVRRG